MTTCFNLRARRLRSFRKCDTKCGCCAFRSRHSCKTFRAGSPLSHHPARKFCGLNSVCGQSACLRPFLSRKRGVVLHRISVCIGNHSAFITTSSSPCGCSLSKSKMLRSCRYRLSPTANLPMRRTSCAGCGNFRKSICLSFVRVKASRCRP